VTGPEEQERTRSQGVVAQYALLAGTDPGLLVGGSRHGGLLLGGLDLEPPLAVSLCALNLDQPLLCEFIAPVAYQFPDNLTGLVDFRNGLPFARERLPDPVAL
jgi:hypothetical protein